MQLRRFLVHFAWTIPEIQVNEEKHRVTQLPSFLTYSFYLLYLLTLINFFKPACHGRRCQCFRKPIKLSHCIYVYTDINFFYAYKWDCNGTNGVSHLLLCSPISSYPGDKLIVTNWYFYTPFRILRRIFSVCTRERSFYSRVLTCNRDIYDGTRSIDAHGSLFTVLRKVQLASEKISFLSSSPSPPTIYVKPNSNIQDSVDYPRVSVRDDDVANLLRIPQMRKTSGYTYTRSI